MTEAFSAADRVKPVARKGAASAARSVEEWRSELEIERALGWLFFDIHRLISKDFEGRTGTLGLTRVQWRVLFALRRAEVGKTQTELADLIEMEKAPLGKILDRLEAGGWIVRKSHPTDRRARLVYATSRIEKFRDELTAAAKGTFARTLQGMRQGEVKDLIAQLRKLKRNLGGAED